MINLQPSFLPETQYFQLTDNSLDLDLKCYALSYQDKSMGVKGFFEFGIESESCQSFFLTKYNCTLEEAEPEITEDIFWLLVDKIDEKFGIDIEIAEEDYYWIPEYSTTMTISYIFDEYFKEEEEE